MPRIFFASLVLPLALTAMLAQACGQMITRASPTATPVTPTLAVTRAATLRPTATPAPYTPAPTATPTVTPTPVVYNIKAGDTLLAVAMQFDVSLEALQDANGITDPRGLHPGDEIMIPRRAAAASAADTATPVATPLPFAVQNVAFSRTPLGGLWCLGEIYNTTGVDLEQSAVTVTLLDEQQKPLAREQAYAGVDLVPPGGKAPFAVRFAEPPATFASYLVSASDGVRGFVGNYYRDLQARDLHGTGERYSAYTVQGTIANTGPEDAVEVLVTVTLYDSLGRVIAMRRAAPEHNVILRGGATDFSLQLTPSGGPVASMQAVALGRRAPTPTPGGRAP